ncbi:hypothetical protein HK099_003605, partial [Clydaea vesicula]
METQNSNLKLKLNFLNTNDTTVNNVENDKIPIQLTVNKISEPLSVKHCKLLIDFNFESETTVICQLETESTFQSSHILLLTCSNLNSILKNDKLVDFTYPNNSQEKIDIQSIDRQKFPKKKPYILIKNSEPDQIKLQENFKISYTIKNSDLSGLHFVLPDYKNNRDRFPYFYTHSPDWIPRVESTNDICTWELQISVPSTLNDIILQNSYISNFFEYKEDLDLPIVAISSGKLIKNVNLPKQGRRIFLYELNTPVNANSILMTVGPFVGIKLKGWDDVIHHTRKNHQVQSEAVPDQDNLDQNTPINCESDSGYAFCLPGWEEDLEYTVDGLASCLEFIEKYVGSSYPFSSFKIVFMEDTILPSFSGASILFCANHLLLQKDIIDQVYITKKILCKGLVKQWIGHSLVYKHATDIWLFVGLVHYITSLYLKQKFGTNEWKYNLKRDMDRVCDLDINQPPLCPIFSLSPPENTQVQDPIDYFYVENYHPDEDTLNLRSEFLVLKSTVILYMLDKRLGQGSFQKVLNKIMVNNISGDLDHGLSTRHFLKICRNTLQKVDIVKSFAEQWIFRAGVPKFMVGWKFNRKLMKVEFTFSQSNIRKMVPGCEKYTDDLSAKKFTGPFTIRIIEPNGTFDTEIHIEDQTKIFNIPYHSRARKQKKIQQKKGEVIIPDEEETFDKTFEWIRLDPELDWLCVKIFIQTENMSISMLRNDKDVIAQYEAIEALGRSPSKATCKELSSIIMNQEYFYRVRMDAVFNVAKCATEDLDNIGLIHLKQLYKDFFCFQNGIPKLNNFSYLQDYFVKKTVPCAISKIRNSDGIHAFETRKFLLDLLKQNDNAGNSYSDNYFLAALIEAVGDSFLPPIKTGKRKNVWEALNESRISTAASMVAGFIDPEKDNSIQRDSLIIEEFDIDDEDGTNHEAAVVSKRPQIGSDADWDLLAEALEEINKIRKFDRLICSYHNTITTSCLKVLLKWMMSDVIPVDINLFLIHSRYGNFVEVRLVSFDALIMLDGLSNLDILKYFLKTINYDLDPYIQYYCSQLLFEISNANCGIVAEQDWQNKEKGGTGISNEDSLFGLKLNFFKILMDLKTSLTINEDFTDLLYIILNSNPFIRIQKNIARFSELLFDTMQEPKLIQHKVIIKLSQSATPSFSNQLEDGESSDEEEKKKKLSTFKYKKPGSPSDNKTYDPIDQTFLDICLKMLNRLMSHSYAQPFTLPVPKDFPGYYTVIKNPMCLIKVKKRLELGAYSNNLDILAFDIRQIFANCIQFNKENSEVRKCLKKFQPFFENEVYFETRKELKLAKKMGKDYISLDSSISSDFKVLTLEETLKCTKLIKKVESLKEAIWFKNPVDPIAANIPLYYKLIEIPMDISTVKAKLESNRYTSTSHFKDDFELIIRNAGFSEAFPELKSKDIPNSLKKNGIEKCSKALQHLESFSVLILPFLFPVDAEFTDYHSIIESPMDIGTIRLKVFFNGYKNLKSFYNDVKLVFYNCKKFNPSDTEIYSAARELDDIFEKNWKLLKGFEEEEKDDDIMEIDLTTENSNSSLKPIVGENSMLKKPSVKFVLKNQKNVVSPQTENSILTSKDNTSETPTPIIYPPIPPPKIIVKNSSASSNNEEVKHLKYTVNNTAKAIENQNSHLKYLDAKFITTDIGKRCQQLLAKLKKNPNARFFLEPVDAVALGIPEYFDVIHFPMDLGTVGKKLEKGNYSNFDQFKADIELIFSNCFLYNLPGEIVYEEGKELENYFKEISDEKKLKKEIKEKKKDKKHSQSEVTDDCSIDIVQCKKILEKLSAADVFNLFAEPVDPIALNIPHYLDIIHNPMDFKTIKGKLLNEVYSSFEDFKKDIQLTFDNCFTFNSPSQEVYIEAKKVEKVYLDILKKSVNLTKVKLSTATPVPSDPIPNMKIICTRVLEKVKKHELSTWFLEPVSKKAVPLYYKEIAEPMDLGTMQKKVNNGKYKSFEEFQADMDLIVSNCKQFNGPDDLLTINVKNLKDYFYQELNNEINKEKTVELDIEYSDYENLVDVDNLDDLDELLASSSPSPTDSQLNSAVLKVL